MAWSIDFSAEFARRLILRNKLIEDEILLKRMQVYYKYHPVEFINDWCVTFDPRAKIRLMPFKLYPRQEDFVRFIVEMYQTKQNGLVEKSRDMGATWLCCAISVWMWLFWPGTIVGWGSMTEDDIDQLGNPKSIFPKIRQIIDYLPRCLMPEGFRMSIHGLRMRIINPDNGAIIIGEAGKRMGRGGRTSIYFKDESAHYEKPELIEAALGDNTDVQIDMSSVNGSANVFYRRRMGGEEWAPFKDIPAGVTRVFIFDWHDNPLKSQEWYEQRKTKADREGLSHIFAQEVDRDYAGSIERIIIPPAWVRSSVDAHVKLNFTDEGYRVAGQDVADGGADKNALIIVKGVITRFADHWAGDSGEAARRARPIIIEHKVEDWNYDAVGVGSGYKTEINNLREKDLIPNRIRIQPWNGGSAVMDPTDHIIPGDIESPTNEDQYTNLKAQSWFRTRARFYKTWRAVEHGDKYPSEELISIDSTLALKNQLSLEVSQAVFKENPKGKTFVDKKPDGALSPNLADGLVIAYNPIRNISIFDVL